MRCILGLVSFWSFWFFLLRNPVFQNQNRDFFSRPNFPNPKLFSETKIYETETKTFFRVQIYRNWDFFSTKFSETETFSENKFSKTETETLKKLAKVSNRNVNLWSELKKYFKILLLIFITSHSWQGEGCGWMYFLNRS